MNLEIRGAEMTQACADNIITYTTSEKGGLLSVILMTVFEIDCFISALEMHQQRLKCLWLIL